MKKIILGAFVQLMMINTSLAQHQIWYFGRGAGLQFNGSNLPTAYGTSTTNPIMTYEGCSLIHNNSGDVIIATDGIKVYDKNGGVMPNGTDLKGNPTSTQSAIIVPVPGCTCNKYFIFTVSSVPTTQVGGIITDGLMYSVVDLSKNSGLGEVVKKNLPLVNSTQSGNRKGNISEKLSCVSDGSGGFWVVAHGENNVSYSSTNGNRFYAFHITALSIKDCDDPSVSVAPADLKVTDIGPEILDDNNHWDTPTIGQMKISPDGSKIAFATWNQKKVHLFSFNLLSGVVGNHIEINDFDCGTYGVEFTRNSKYLYVSETLPGPSKRASIFRYDLTTTLMTAEEIYHVNTPASPNWFYRFGSILLGPDGRLYIANCNMQDGYPTPPTGEPNTIYYIDNPEAAAPVFNSTGVTLPTGTYSYVSLPSIIQSFRDCADPCNKCHNVLVPFKGVNHIMRKDTTIKIGCGDKIDFAFNTGCRAPNSTPKIGISVTDENGTTPPWAINFTGNGMLNWPDAEGTYAVTYYFGTPAQGDKPADTCDRITITIVDTCVIPPCACPPKQQTKLNIFSGRGGPVFQPIATVTCGGKFTGECLKNYTFTSSFTCPDNCTGSSIIRIVSPDKRDTTGSISNFQFNEKGDWQVLMYTRCGDTYCDTCKFTITIPPCLCPPPECCKDQVSFGDNASIKMTASGTGSILTIASTISAGSTTGYKEVRIDVLDVAIESDNKNPACIGCLTNPRQWASIQRAYVNGFTMSQEIPQMNNPREVRFVSSSPKPLNNTPFGFHIILPPPSTLECCKLYAIVTIKITVKDDQCRECTFISRTKLLLANWQMGDVPLTGNPANNNTGARKKNDLFNGCQNCIPIFGLRGVKTAGVKY